MIDARPASNVTNAQAPGIGRVVALRHGCAWNNLGRNVVFADDNLGPTAIFGDTMFPGDPETSEFDLDVHAIVELGDDGRTGVLNHLGTLRVFTLPKRATGDLVGPNLREERRLGFVADVERVATAGDRLVTSRPRGQRLPGVLVSEPIGSAGSTVGAVVAEESFGVVTALATGTTTASGGWFALGGEGRVRLAEMANDRSVSVRWDAEVPFLPAVIAGDARGLWVAGSALGGTDLDDYDWERLVGGGLARLDLATGEVLVSGRFDADLAWGSGGVPVVVVDRVPCGIDRRGGLHALVPGDRVTTPVTAPVADESLGIAHAAVVGRHVVFGFNRGGYRLHAVDAARIIAAASRGSRRA